MMTDPIADLLTRLRNGMRAGLKEVGLPASKLKVRIAEILTAEGYVEGHELIADGRQGVLKIRLRYNKEGAAITGIKRISRPGRRVYVGSDEIPPVLNGIGRSLLSTSSGVMTDRQARAAGVGGELLCSLW
ncbi:MAG: 30S ribosomal protein S8 [Deltaproteobacteria bacterium]|nr:30S ribosomal protein S8 [Deltaproteobacteria bacterium]